MMTLKELDRLVTRTDINETSKKALRHVRSAIISGKCSDPMLGSGAWSVAIESEHGNSVKVSFSFRKD
jgi:hypothetical protein